jgi:hypothetical protein
MAFFPDHFDENERDSCRIQVLLPAGFLAAKIEGSLGCRVGALAA